MQNALPPLETGNDLADLIVLGDNIAVEEEGIEITANAVANGDGNEVVAITEETQGDTILANNA